LLFLQSPFFQLGFFQLLLALGFGAFLFLAALGFFLLFLLAQLFLELDVSSRGLGVSTFGVSTLGGGGGAIGSFLTSGTGFGGTGFGITFGTGLGGSGGVAVFFTGSGSSCHKSTTIGLAIFFCQLRPNTRRPKNITCTRTASAPEAMRPGSSALRNLTPAVVWPAAQHA
jgi:hypothetical protein